MIATGSLRATLTSTVLCCVMLIDHLNRKTTLSVITLRGVQCNNYETDLLKGILHLNDPFSGRVHGPSCSLMTLFGRPQIFSARNLKNMTQLFLFRHLTVLLFPTQLIVKINRLKRYQISFADFNCTFM